MDHHSSSRSSTMDKPSKHLHIAMLPWVAFGHLIPFLNLAKTLSRKGHSISFLSTSNNIERLPNTTNQLIQFIELSLPPTPGLPPGAEATSDLSYHQFPSLKVAYDRLQPQLLTFLESSSPHWLILDFAPYWAVPIASKLGIRTAFFSIFKASSLSFIGPFITLGVDDPTGPEPDTRTSLQDWTVKPNWVPFDSNVAFRYFEAEKMSNCLGENVSGATDGQRIAAILRTCDVIAPRCSFEFEAEWINLLSDLCKRPVVPVGHLPPVDDSIIAADDDWKPVIDWLSKWPQNSVIYVAFGSEATLTKEELTELALGLEMSNLPFFWALRAQEDDLPEGFAVRTKERGVVWSRWAPQLRILSHGSVGGFLCHSGWSSVIEGIMLQKPLILFPLYSDQGLVARVLEEKRLGYPIPRDERDGSFSRAGVAESLTMVVVGEGGRDYRLNVKEMSPLFGDVDSQAQYVDSFANFLQTHQLHQLQE